MKKIIENHSGGTQFFLKGNVLLFQSVNTIYLSRERIFEWAAVVRIRKLVYEKKSDWTVLFVESNNLLIFFCVQNKVVPWDSERHSQLRAVALSAV